MIIRQLNIKNFGKIHDKTLEFSPGINVLYGENESGKTTIHTFIKSMFFGLTRMRGKAARNDTYSTYEPWENPGQYGGTIWFNSKGHNYRLSRNFQKDHAFSELLNEDTKELADIDAVGLEKVLGNVSEAVYDNTVSVAQLKSVTGQDLVRELQNYMASFQGTGDSSIDLGRAMQMLKMSRKGYQVQADKKQKETEQEQQKLQVNMDYIAGEMNDLREKIAQIDEKEGSLGMRPGEENGALLLDEKLAETRKKRNGYALGMLASAAVGIIGLITSALAANSIAVSLTAVAIAAGLVFFCGRQQMKYAREFQKRVRMKNRWMSRQEKLKWSKESLKQDYDEKETDFRNLQEEYREYEENSYLPTLEEMEVQALNLAMETIEMLSENIHHQVGRKLRTRTSQILSEITGGKYQEVLMDAAFHMTVNTGDRTIGLERLSRGTMEQIYFSLRMAAGELLCQEESFPVILDDVFGMYDEERLAAVLKWMHKENKQIIISTCHKREMEILDREGIPYQKLLLS